MINIIMAQVRRGPRGCCCCCTKTSFTS